LTALCDGFEMEFELPTADGRLSSQAGWRPGQK